MPCYGIIGDPVEQSLSPTLHAALYRITGHNGTYGRFGVKPESLSHVIPALKTLGVSGVNVTSPYKQAIITFLDSLSPEAREIGAVNTVRFGADGFTTGYNTDCSGFAESLLHAGITISGGHFVVCGAGGAGRAVIHALSQNGAGEITVASTTPQKGIPYNELLSLPPKDVIINCTPLGMAGREHECPVPAQAFSRFSVAVDLIYNPAETLFLKTARKQGLKTLNGLSMLVFQGIKAFEIWTGITPPESAVNEIMETLTCNLLKKQV